MCFVCAQSASRRQVLGASAAALSLLVASSPAQAFLGFGEEGQLAEAYTAETVRGGGREGTTAAANAVARGTGGWEGGCWPPRVLPSTAICYL